MSWQWSELELCFGFGSELDTVDTINSNPTAAVYTDSATVS